MSEKITIPTTKSGLPYFDVGGGATTNKFSGCWVLNDRLRLKNALFIKSRGPLACSLKQAIVPLAIGDFIVTGHGPLPVNLDNPEFTIDISRVDEISLRGKDSEALISKVNSDVRLYVPEPVRIGLRTYHNRDGSFFCISKGAQS
ncbi:MAG: hypothetical protein KAS32_05735 [Candidatus Peribacteraceae bacterium]|nr:hypothetical protein [Candidatus Peribacteraceae bacterium]